MSSPDVDRKAPCPCGSGRRYRSCCQSRDRALAEALDAARVSHKAIDDVMGNVLTVLVSRGGHTIACKSGCNACCEYFVTVSYGEALAIAEHLLEPANAALLARFEAALPVWLATSPDFDELDALTRRRHAHNEADNRRFEQLRTELEVRRVLCPFAESDGLCGIYAVRPVVCRAWAVADTAELCGRRPDLPAPPIIRHPAIESTIDQARDLMEGTLRQHPGHGPGVLGMSVARALKELRQRRR